MNLFYAFLGLLALDLGLQWFHLAPVLSAVLTVALVVMGVLLAVRFGRQAIRTTIWRLRNRLMVAYAFIAVVPILLILALIAAGTWIVAGQMGVFLVSSELERRLHGLEAPALILARARPEDRTAIISQMAPLIQDRLPGFELFISDDKELHYPDGSRLGIPPAGWGDHTGYVVKDGEYYCFTYVHARRSRVVIMAPINADLLGKLAPGLGVVNLLTDTAQTNRKDTAGRIPAATNFLDFETPWIGRLPFHAWDKPGRAQTTALVVYTRPSAVLSAMFHNQMDDGQNILVAFIVVAILLMIVEVLSLVVGVSLSRTITGAVHGLYEGTTRIAKGDFAYRIPVKGRDQLAALGTSFNNMTSQLESLVAVAKEKERLQSELEIASEVQNQLFPRSAPVMRTIDVMGVCEPARMVSGDYYDYLCLSDGNLALALGDVAGKGISAALLMASIQSIMRTQLAAGLSSSATAGAGGGPVWGTFSTARVVAQLNRQLYANTAPEKYATFFFGVYDENSRVLTYTNAGHLPPLLLRKGTATPLEVTGTVVGIFPVAVYEEQTVRLEAGDVLIAYTDGITEPENEYGEEFGADRLVEVAMRHQGSEPKEIIARIMEAVTHWSKADELPDDMTVVVARGRA